MGYTFFGWINIACDCIFLKYYAKKINCIIVKDCCAIMGLNQKGLENQGILA